MMSYPCVLHINLNRYHTSNVEEAHMEIRSLNTLPHPLSYHQRSLNNRVRINGPTLPPTLVPHNPSYPLQFIYIALDHYQAHTLMILILVQSHTHTHTHGIRDIIRVGLRNSIPHPSWLLLHTRLWLHRMSPFSLWTGIRISFTNNSDTLLPSSHQIRSFT